MEYNIRVVAFIDILGLKSPVDKSNEDEQEFNGILNALTELKDLFIKSKDYYEIKANRELDVLRDEKYCFL